MEPKAIKYVKGYGFLSFARKYKKQILNKGLDTFEKVVHKAGEFIGKKADAVTKSNDDNIQKQEPVEEIIIPPEKKEKILNKLRRVV